MFITGQRTFDDMGAPLFEVPFCVLDLETTGGSAADCEITEIGAVRYVGGDLAGTFHSLVNPGIPIPPFITILTGITEAMVIQAPELAIALPAFLEFIGNAVIVGHNVRFDLSFLNAAAERFGYGRLQNRFADTAALARRLVHSEVRNLKLRTLAAHFRAPVQPTHRALDDARATAHVFWSLLERAGTLGVTHLEDLMALPTARGARHYEKISLTDSLPREPGVYLFCDRDDNVIYVGKAKNLRARVRSYFYGDTRKSVAAMLRDLDRIDYRVCENELEAQITELRLIAANLPRYNRRSRPPRSPHWVKLTKERFPRLSLVRTVRPDGLLYLGPLRSRRAAERVQHAIWDALPIRRCTTRGGKRSAACGFAQLGVALCPCGGDVTQQEYNAVVSRLRGGVEEDPASLLDVLAQKMRDLAERERFEEAADIRDRHRALAAAIERRRAWQALVAAGLLRVEDEHGDGAVIEGARLLQAWRAGRAAPLIPLSRDQSDDSPVPPTMTAAEECRLVWRWLNRPGVQIIDGERPLVWPIKPVARLEEAAALPPMGVRQ